MSWAAWMCGKRRKEKQRWKEDWMSLLLQTVTHLGIFSSILRVKLKLRFENNLWSRFEMMIHIGVLPLDQKSGTNLVQKYFVFKVDLSIG